MSVDHDSSCGPSGSSCKRRNDLAPSVWLSRGELIHHLLLKEEAEQKSTGGSGGAIMSLAQSIRLHGSMTVATADIVAALGRGFDVGRR